MVDKNYLPNKITLAPKYQMDGNIIDDPLGKMQKKIIKDFKDAHDKFINENRNLVVNINDVSDVTISVDVEGKQCDITHDFFGG